MTRVFYAPEGTPEPAAAPPATEATPPAEPQWTGMATQFPREVRERHKDLLLGDYKDKKAHEVFEELVDAKGKLSRSIVIPDPKTATPEERAAFNKTMGIADTPDAYDLKTDAYKDMKGIDDMAKDFRTRAAGWGLTKGQAGQVFDFVASLGKFGQDSQAKAKADYKASFQTRLLEAVGGNEDEAKEITTRLTAFMSKQIADPELVKAFDESGLLYSPKLAAKLAELSKAFDDAPMPGGKAPTGQAPKGSMGDYSKAFDEEFGGKR